MPSRSRATTFIAWSLGIVVLAASVFFVVARGAVEMRALSSERATARFDSMRALFDNELPATDEKTKLTRLRILAYRVSDEELAEGDIPFWFVRLKSPVLEFMLRGTRVDLEELGIRASDLQERGPGVVLDRREANGDHLLIWVE